ncbi:hypothetical protein NB703_002040 [Pantoea ananatis]|uniref:Uncharacterized protein n=1 Tax=Pantoea ananas TaxID=553 RepID=A0AAJ1FPY2_PANAN|nr:hypothetical protein [Pantoea ananatis]MCW0343947.1 hypothetical protein [Pantoea ananatis]MCW0352400.1 hypothetical protein [Pantoea ananatis]
MLSGGKVPAILNNGGHRVALILLPAKLDAQTYSPFRGRHEATFMPFTDPARDCGDIFRRKCTL